MLVFLEGECKFFCQSGLMEKKRRREIRGHEGKGLSKAENSAKRGKVLYTWGSRTE
jgi:hypothetical protein